MCQLLWMIGELTTK